MFVQEFSKVLFCDLQWKVVIGGLILQNVLAGFASIFIQNLCYYGMLADLTYLSIVSAEV